MSNYIITIHLMMTYAGGTYRSHHRKEVKGFTGLMSQRSYNISALNVAECAMKGTQKQFMLHDFVHVLHHYDDARLYLHTLCMLLCCRKLPGILLDCERCTIECSAITRSMFAFGEPTSDGY